MPPALIATHSGSFHADDVFGVAVLAALHPQHQIVRTRDPERIALAAFAVDVGGEWDPGRGRFDHHQRSFTGARTRIAADGTPQPGEAYASAGLVWREYGAAYVRHVAGEAGHALDDPAAAEIARDIDESLVRYLDLVDNGAAEVAPGAFGLSSQIAMLNPNWLEEQAGDPADLPRLQLARFREGMVLVQRLLQRFVVRALGQRLAADRVRAAERLHGGRVLFLAEGGMPWTRVVLEEMPEVRLVLSPDAEAGRYQLRTVPVAAGSFASRMDLPAEWAGLRDEELAAASGVPDAAFCHTKRFIAVARSLDGALRLAQLALAAAGFSASPR